MDWLAVITPLTVLALFALYRFVGCKFDPSGTGGGGELGDFPDYGINILAETDLVSYWRLRDAACAAGDTARDEKDANPGSFRITALAADGPLLSPAAPGTLQCSQPALLEDAADDASIGVDGGYVHVPFSSDLNPSEFSVEAWVRPEWPAAETGVFHCIVASRDDTGDGKRGYILYAGPRLALPSSDLADPDDPAIRWQAWVGDGTNWRAVVSDAPVVPGLVTYLCAIYDRTLTQTTLTFYAVNEQTDLETVPIADDTVRYLPNRGKPLYIGMGATERAVPDPGPLYPFKGGIQEVAVYRAALTREAVTNHIMAGLGL